MNPSVWPLFSLLWLPWVEVGAPAESVQVRFVDVSGSSGLDFVHINGEPDVKNYIFEAKGGGIAFLDYDNDGWLDVYVVQGSTLERFRRGDNPHGALFRNRRDGTFEDVTKAAGLTAGGWGMGVAAADFDNDGWADLYLTNFGPNRLYRNQGDGTFADVTDRSGLGDPRWSSSAAFGDYDRDGHLDVYVCNYITLDLDRLPEPGSGGYCVYKGVPVLCGPRGLPGAADALYRNNGDGTFSDVTLQAGVVDRDRLFGLAAVWADIDDDGDPDLYVANDDGPNLLYLNRGDGTFEEMGALTGLAVSMDGRNQGSMGVDVADYDNDGRLDVYVAHFASDYSTLYRNQGNLLFEDVTGRTPIREATWHRVGWGTRFADFDLDGWKDIFQVNGHVTPFVQDLGIPETYEEPAQFFLNDTRGGFIDASRSAGPDLMKGRCSRGAAFGDFDNDGDIDVVVASMNGRPTLFRNDTKGGRHWLTLRTRGTRSNRDGIGARITVESGGLRQVWEARTAVSIFSASDPRAHFGLGGNRMADRIEVRWPGGGVQEFRDVAADRHYWVDEDKGLETRLP